MHGEGVKYDYARYLIFEFHRGRKSIESARKSKALRPHPIYLGGVLVLTRIIYYALNIMHMLPAPLHIPQGVIPRHSTRPRDRASKPQAPKKEVPKKKEEERKMATRSGVKEEKKTVPISPPTSSPSNETKHFEDELRKAMALSEKEQRKANEEELQLLK